MSCFRTEKKVALLDVIATFMYLFYVLVLADEGQSLRITLKIIEALEEQ